MFPIWVPMGGGNNGQQIGIKCEFYFYNDVDAVQRGQVRFQHVPENGRQ